MSGNEQRDYYAFEIPLPNPKTKPKSPEIYSFQTKSHINRKSLPQAQSRIALDSIAKRYKRPMVINVTEFYLTL